MNLRTTLIGFLGGLGVTAALYYPLYVVVPWLYVPGWESGDLQKAWIGLGLAACLLLLTGFLAGLFTAGSRWKRLWAGAAAGLLAAGMAFCVYGAPAAGVFGSRLLLEYGFRPAPDDAQFVFLVMEPTIGVIVWTHLAWLGLSLAGFLLGLLGGVLSPRLKSLPETASPPFGADFWFRWAFFLLTLAGFTVQLALFPTLYDKITAAVQKLALTPSLPPILVLLCPILAFFLPLVFGVAYLAAWHRRILRMEPAGYLHLYIGLISADVAAGWLLFSIGFLPLPTSVLWFNLALLALRLLLAGWLACQAFRMIIRLRAAFPDRKLPPVWLILLLVLAPAAFLAGLALALPVLQMNLFATSFSAFGAGPGIRSIWLAFPLAASLGISAIYVWPVAFALKRQPDFLRAFRQELPAIPGLARLRELADLALRLTIWGGLLVMASLAAALPLVLIVIVAIAPLMGSPGESQPASVLETVRSTYTIFASSGGYAWAGLAALYLCAALAFGGWLLRRGGPAETPAQEAA